MWLFNLCTHATVSPIFYADSNCTQDEERSIAAAEEDDSAYSMWPVPLDWNSGQSIFI